MKTLKQLSFPTLENEFLENTLRQLAHQFAVIQMFYNKSKPGTQAVLVIHLQQKQDADTLQVRPWVEKLKTRYKTFVYCVYSTRLHHKYSLGHPFIAAYCGPSAVIYQNEDTGEPLLIRRNWAKYREKFHDFEEHFYNGHEGRFEQLQKLISEGALNSVFTAYKRLIGYDLDYLEDLYTGHPSNSKCLNERINHLIPYVPEIQKYFVRKNSNSYYLTEVFAKAQKGIDEGESTFDDDLSVAVGIAEKGLYSLIETRLAALKKLVKKRSNENQQPLIATDSPKDEILELAVSTVVKSVEVEQVYFFHQATYGEQKTYYLLLIARGMDNEKLKSLTQSLQSKTGENIDFVLISHERYWIQKNLFQYQQFFFTIVQHKNLVYASSDCHPEFHWLKPHEPYHGDLYLHYSAFRRTVRQFGTLANHTDENSQGLASIFTLLFLSFCQTCMLAKTYYMPNTLPSRALWKLCVYADPKLYKYLFLFEQFPGDLFGFLDRHRTIHMRISKADKMELNQMKAIVAELEKELYDWVVNNGQLTIDNG